MFLRNYIIIVLFISTFTACSNNLEQNPVIPIAKGKIQGIITEANTNIPLSNVLVITNPETKEVYTTSDGAFILDDISIGDYKIYVSKSGYDNDSISVTVKDGLTSDVNILLRSFSEYFDYYPLDIGSYWEYESFRGNFSLEIISDTAISQIVYRVIEEKSLLTGYLIDIRYERLDSVTSLVYRYYPEFGKEFIIDSLAAKISQRFTSNMFVYPYQTISGNLTCIALCNGIRAQDIFGELRSVRILYHYCATDQPGYNIAKGLGIINVSYWYAGMDRLKYARIAGIEYGEKY